MRRKGVACCSSPVATATNEYAVQGDERLAVCVLELPNNCGWLPRPCANSRRPTATRRSWRFRIPPVGAPMRRTGWVVAGVGLVVLAAKKTKKRARRARKVYVEEVSSGARPIQAVGTSIAAFVGFG